MNRRPNLAARMARWSSKNRKKAFWGWLAFVILAFAIGNAIGPNLISDVDNFNGESHDAEVALDRAGLRPQSEVVFVQSDDLTIKDPQFKATVEDVTRSIRKVPYVEHVKSPLTGESAVMRPSLSSTSQATRPRPVTGSTPCWLPSRPPRSAIRTWMSSNSATRVPRRRSPR
jgi:predicted RND superfamily exporter protein